MADSWHKVVAADLERITGREWKKKRNTIIQIVDARLSERSDASALLRPDTCSKTIFYNKWMKDPVFKEVLENATSSAKRYMDEENLRAIERAATLLQLASPRAVARLLALLDSEEERIVLDASKSVLDRAGVATAIKSAVATHSTEGEGLSLDEWRAQAGIRGGQVDATLEDFEDWEDDEEDPEEDE